MFWGDTARLLFGNAPATTKCMHAESGEIDLLSSPHGWSTRGLVRAKHPRTPYVSQ